VFERAAAGKESRAAEYDNDPAGHEKALLRTSQPITTSHIHTGYRHRQKRVNNPASGNNGGNDSVMEQQVNYASDQLGN
jgi:hypothetical protein